MKNCPLLDKRMICLRFFECYAPKTPYELAIKLGVHPPLVYRWQDGDAPVPWCWLKKLVDEQRLSWDWLVDGKDPKHRKRRKNEVLQAKLERHAINQRYLSLFPNMSHVEIGKEISVNPGTISKWRRDLSQVPWERLKDAVDKKSATWEWLLEGREPKKSRNA